MPDNHLTTYSYSDELIMICSMSGRVLQVSDSMEELIGQDLVGKNLNDLMEDRVVSKLIRSVNAESVFEFDCVIAGRAFGCGAKLSQSNHISIVLIPAIPKGQKESGGELIRLLGSEINSNVSSINIALSSAMQKGGVLSDEAYALAMKSVLNLSRISKNAVLKVDYEKGTVVSELIRGDMAAVVAETCLRAIEFCRAYATIGFDGVRFGLDCVFDETAVKRLVLNLISHGISLSGRKQRAEVAVRSEITDDALVLTLIAKGPGKTEEPSELAAPVRFGEEMELDIATIIARKCRGSIISSGRRDGGKILRASLPIVVEHGDRVLSSPMIDWYGGMDMVAVEMAEVMPAEAYLPKGKNGRQSDDNK